MGVEDFVLLETPGQPMSARLCLDSAGALSEFREQFTSLDLQKKALEWWGTDAGKAGHRNGDWGVGTRRTGRGCLLRWPFPAKMEDPAFRVSGDGQTVVKPESDTESQKK